MVINERRDKFIGYFNIKREQFSCLMNKKNLKMRGKSVRYKICHILLYSLLLLLLLLMLFLFAVIAIVITIIAIAVIF